MSDFGKLLIGLGVLMILLGGVLFLTGKVPWLGRLPGDIKVERENWSFYFPLGTSLLLSVVLSLILWLFSRR
jgi:ribose/xylose/arabinose/galactoside ABC-type transport system permease subunit